jgi:hypothetical protein
VILNGDRDPLGTGSSKGPLPDRPRSQHSLDREAEVVMKLAGPGALHGEEQPECEELRRGGGSSVRLDAAIFGNVPSLAIARSLHRDGVFVTPSSFSTSA